VTTPLVCGDHASLTIMIFIQRMRETSCFANAVTVQAYDSVRQSLHRMTNG
jgi:hypothetical protein